MALAAALMLVFYINMPLWRDEYFGTRDTPLFYIALVISAGLVASFNMRNAVAFLSTPFAQWCIAAMVVYSINYARLLYLESPTDDINESYDRVQFSLLAPCIGYLVYRIKKRVFIPFLKLVAVIVPLLLIADFLFPDFLRSGLEEEIDRLTSKSRVVGTWNNPNAAAEAIVLGVILARDLYSRFAMAVVYSIAGIALIFTASRSGIVIFAMLGIYLLFKRRLPLFYILVPVLTVVFFPNFLALVEDIASIIGRDRNIGNTINRLEFLSGASAELDDSSIARSEAFTFSLVAAMQHPFIGHGIEYWDPVSGAGPHNLIASWFHLYGVGGVLLWLGMVVVLYKAYTQPRWLNPALIVFVWYSFFTHNLMENNFWFIFLAISVYWKLDDHALSGTTRSRGFKKFDFNFRRGSSSSKSRRKRKRTGQSMRW